MDDVLLSAVEALVTAINARNRTPDHSLRVARYATQFAQFLGFEGTNLEKIRIGALLHDIGHVLFPDALIEKAQGQLSEPERQIVRGHPTDGAELIQRWPSLRFVAPYILYHQEWVDGSGYPFGLIGDAIPLEVQIVSIADVYEALHHARSYRGRAGLPHQEVIDIMRETKGRRWREDLFEQFVTAAASWI